MGTGTEIDGKDDLFDVSIVLLQVLAYTSESWRSPSTDKGMQILYVNEVRGWLANTRDNDLTIMYLSLAWLALTLILGSWNSRPKGALPLGNDDT